MLESMRRGAQSWVAKVLFALLVVSFAIWGVEDVFRGWGRGAIATVGGTKITAEEFQRAFQNELDRISRETNQRINADQGRAFGLDRRVLGQLIGGTAIEEHAEKLGLKLSSATLVEGIQADPDFQDANGRFSREGMQGMLRQIGMSEEAFLRLRRKDELRSLLIGALVAGQTVPKPLIDLVHNHSQETRVIEWIKIDPDAVKVTEPDEAKLKELYETDKAKFMTPEYRKVQVLMLTVDDLKKQIPVTDEEIAKAYEATKETYNTPEQRRIQQIAFKDRAAAEVALKALRDGKKSFGDIAKEAGAKDADVDLGMVTRKSLIDPKVAEAAFSLQKDKFSDVVEGRFATVILRVTQIEPGITRTLADVKDQVKDKVASDKAATEIRQKHDDVEDLRAGGKTLAEIAADTKLMLKEVAATDSQGLSPDGKPVMETPDLPKLVAQVFSPDAGGDSEALELTGGGYAWTHLVSTDAPKQKTFEEVKTEIKDGFMVSERKRLLQEMAKTLADRVNVGEPMKALEGAAKSKVETTDKITRKTQPQGLSNAAVAQGFALAKGRAGYATSSDKATEVVIRVADVIAAPAPTATQTETLTRDLSNDLAGQSLVEYTESLKTSLGASINEAELKSVLGSSDQ